MSDTATVDPMTTTNDGTTDEEAAAGDGLFDKADYTDPKLYLDQVDEKDVDKIRLDFSGSILLDRRNPDDVEFMRGLKLGQDVTLKVEAAVSSKRHGYTTGRDGDLDAVVYTAGFRVHTLYPADTE
jgi:hypothetical protein